MDTALGILITLLHLVTRRLDELCSFQFCSACIHAVMFTLALTFMDGYGSRYPDYLVAFGETETHIDDWRIEALIGLNVAAVTRMVRSCFVGVYV